jgi:hypothetical protein
VDPDGIKVSRIPWSELFKNFSDHIPKGTVPQSVLRICITMMWIQMGIKHINFDMDQDADSDPEFYLKQIWLDPDFCMMPVRIRIQLFTLI